jgi:DNA-binding transcriptional regulator GbsR (MarR family)
VVEDGLDLGPELVEFVEQFGLYWQRTGNPRMEGRVLAYLIVTKEPFVSANRLATALQASPGSISNSTRRLVEVGFVKRHAVGGDRNHYYRAEDDVWGSFLGGERFYLRYQSSLAEAALKAVGEEDTPTRRRLQNMRDYMTWLEARHKQLQREWTEYKASHAISRDAAGRIGAMATEPLERASSDT